MVQKEIITNKEIIEQTAVEPDLLNQMVERKLIKSLGSVDGNVLVFEKQAVQQIEQIKQFYSMGYSIDDIEKILKKIGLPSTNKLKASKDEKVSYLTVGDLANRLGINSRTIKFWEERGIVEPDTRSDGGFRLYADYWVYLCNLIQDLQLFGYSLDEIKEISDLFRDFLAIQQSLQAFPYEDIKSKLQTMREGIRLFFDKMNQFKEGIHRWEELLKKKKKKFDILKIKSINYMPQGKQRRKNHEYFNSTENSFYRTEVTKFSYIFEVRHSKAGDIDFRHNYETIGLGCQGFY
jgi:DNA-binding transcriptional MerR regulator